MRDASICGLGQTASSAIESAIKELAVFDEHMTRVPAVARARFVELEIDGETVRVPEGATILEACRARGIDMPTLCFGETLTPVNVCRVCVVEVEGSRVARPGLLAQGRGRHGGPAPTRERVRHSRKLVLELLARRSTCRPPTRRLRSRIRRSPSATAARAAADAGVATPPAGHHHAPTARRGDRRPAGQGRQRPLRPRLRANASSATSASRPAAPSGRTPSRSRSPAAASMRTSPPSTPSPLPDSACVYCGNCIAVCPTGALMFKTRARHARRRHVGRGAADRHRHDLPVLRRRLHARPCTCRTTRSSRSRRRSTTASPTATSASRAGSAISTCRTASRGYECPRSRTTQSQRG